MKRLFVITLCLFLLLSVSASAAGNPVLLNKDGIKIVAKDARYEYSSLLKQHRLYFDVIVTNDTKKDYTVTCTKGYIDGWEIEGQAYINISAGMKKKEEVYLKLEGADITSASALQGIKELKIQFHLMQADDILNSTNSTKKVNVDWVKSKVKP